MRNIKIIYGILFTICLNFLWSPALSQDEIVTETDSVFVPEIEVEKEHSPRKATMYSAVLPGLGQIYNKSYWKLPIVYGGFIGFGYAISWNQQRYESAKQAYFDLNDDNPETKSYEELLKGYDFNSALDIENANTTLERGVKGFKRQRDLMIIFSGFFYMLNVLDANVDAHLKVFDISEDLSMRIEPSAIDPNTLNPCFGAQLTFNF